MGKFKFTTESFIEEARRVHGDKYDYSKVEYKGTDVKVCIICPKHGEFWQTPKNHLYGRGCLKCYGHYKLTTEEFIEKLKKLYGDKYDYSYVEYNGSYKKVHLVCPIHGDFWIEPNRLMQGQGCHKCGIKMAQMKNRMKQETFIERATQIHNGKYDYSKANYVNTGTKVCIICPEHGEFWQTPHHHLNGIGCPKCGANTLSIEEWKEKALEKHGNKYDYSLIKEIHSKEKIKIICPKHGVFLQNENNHLQGRGCPECFLERKRGNIVEFIEKSKLIHGDKYNYSKVEYINNRNKVCIICPEHGEFYQSPSSHLQGYGCPECSKKFCKSEKKVLKALQEKYGEENVEYQKTFDFLQNGKTHQTIDIFLPKYNIGIEYQGRQHFLPVKRFGGESGYLKIIERDKRKYELCKKNGVIIKYISFEKDIPSSYLSNIYRTTSSLIDSIEDGRYK